MACRNPRPFALAAIAAASFLIPAALGAQARKPADAAPPPTAGMAETETERDYWLEQGVEGIVFKQVLRWENVEHARRYGLEIERSDNAAWAKVQALETAKSEAEVSLKAGDYRYRVTVFDVLDKAASVSEWFMFKIQKAVQPRLTDLSPGRLWLEEEQDGRFTVEGANFLPDTDFTFRDPARPGTKFRGAIVELDARARRAVVSFPVDRMSMGSYELIAENPGGLTARSEPVTLKYQKPTDLDLSVGYMPLFIPMDDTFRTYFGSSAIPLGTAFKITYIPLKRAYGFLGVGFLGAASRASASYDTYELSTNWMSAHVNLAYQKPLIKRRLNLDLRLGAGATMLQGLSFELDNGVTSPDFSPWSVSMDAGAGLHIYPMKRLYIDVACDVSYAFMFDMYSFAVSPSLMAGWQF